MNIQLFTAVLTGDRASTAELLSAGADPNARKTALWQGVIEMVSKHPEFAPALLRREYSDPNPLVIWTWTPLLLACAQGYWDIAENLLDAGAEADVVDEQAQTPLRFAIRGEQSGLVRRLLAARADPNPPTEDGLTHLMTAAALDSGHQSQALVGLRRAARMDAPASPEQRAVYLDIVKALLEYGADVHATATEGDTALTFAASQGWTEVVILLLDAGASMNCEGQFTDTPLIACVPLYPETARLLIDRGADIHAIARWGGTALTHAIGYRPEEFFRFSKRVSTPPSDDSPTFKFLNPRDFLAKDNEMPAAEDLTALTLLLDAGADPNQVSGDEFSTPLITAAIRDAIDAIHCLVERGADINGRDSHGCTPLMMAAWQGQPRAVQALLECGADHTLRSDKGNTALVSATLPGRPEHMLQKLNSMPDRQLDPQMEERLQRLEKLKEKIGERGSKIPDIDQIRRMPADFREGMHASLEHEVAKQARRREKVIKILKGAGATT
jgi:ankyrin repeat protein